MKGRKALIIVPAHKSDLASIERLHTVGDAGVIAVLPELLEWLQDINWPVARGVLERVAVLGNELVEPVRSILLLAERD